MSEAGADVEVVVRADRLNWLHGGKYHRKLGNLAPLVYAPTDVGPMGISRVVAVPGLFRRLPRVVQEPMATRASALPALRGCSRGWPRCGSGSAVRWWPRARRVTRCVSSSTTAQTGGWTT